MAAVLIGVVVGVAMGVWVVSWTEGRVRRSMQTQMDEQRQALVAAVRKDGEQREDLVLEEMISRLLDAALPARDSTPSVAQDESPGEYTPPDVEIGDWTDPFIQHERPLVARLAPGQGIPGISDEYAGDGRHGGPDAIDRWREQGTGAFDEWLEETMVDEQVPVDPATARDSSWVEPLNLD